MSRLLDDSTCAFAAEVIARGPLTRTDLSRRLQLSAPSMTRIQRLLLTRDIVVEGSPEPNPHATGRPTHVLIPSPSPRTFVGVKLTGDHVYAVRTSLTCHQEDQYECALRDRSPEAVMAQTARAIERVSPHTPDHVGISIGGRVYADGRVIEAGYLGWGNTDAGRLLREAGCLAPVTFVNDVEAIGRWEQWFGLGRSFDNFSSITLGAGVGHVVIHHGRILHRRETQLGFIGHLPLAADSPRTCWLGHRGCAAAVLNLGALVEAVREACPASQLPDLRPRVASSVPGITADPQVAWLKSCLDADISGAREVLDNAFVYLARLLAIIVDVTVAEALSLTGELAGILTWGLGDIDAALSDLRDPVNTGIELTMRPDTFDFWARGAAATAIRAWLIDTLDG
ncbi:ROK family protein [Nanchangia anserum]|uniref:ROK family protein n=1 Tax=Nanchangia anserum TaxID=2692125 RepID=A0A8I0KS87_9ACTO|nr:ROK family protein [Nanchangia anserum]MBD3690157.1 ROK family protein [Nanchangia anserum]QOX82387.1 ROK family protein [Nanchangia anserum]